jgi:hypothetical protein
MSVNRVFSMGFSFEAAGQCSRPCKRVCAASSYAERYASGAADSRSEARAEAIGGRLQAMVRRAAPTLLRSATPPIPWPAPLMGHGGNPNLVCKFQVEYGVRKAPDETLAKTRLIMLRKYLRMLLNTGNRTLDLLLQVSAEPRALLLIVRNCCTEFRPRIGMKNDWLHENCARNSSNTWAAGIPTTLPL